VKAAIQQCCLQLKSKIARQAAAKEQRQRKRNLTKYIPNVAAALHTVLQSMVARGGEGGGESWARCASGRGKRLRRAGFCVPWRHACPQSTLCSHRRPNRATPLPPSPEHTRLHACAPSLAFHAAKRRRLEAELGVLPSVRRGEVTEETIAKQLTDHVERIDMDMVGGWLVGWVGGSWMGYALL
jgi:hypothetical protein